MPFNSIAFLFFLVQILAAYYLFPQRWRWLLLLVASYYFYGVQQPLYVLVLLFSTMVDYLAALQIEQRTNIATRRRYLAISILVNLLTLISFKYIGFFNESIAFLLQNTPLAYTPKQFDLLLPIGISFYTFQSMSYTIDVYRNHQRAERHFGIFALYVAFFPQLVAGPIERSSHLLPQFRRAAAFNYDRFTVGLMRIGWGFFKKLIIADRLALMVNPVYADPQQHNGFLLTFATYFFLLQLYCDFSAYCDIAIGIANMLGFELNENFRAPFFARTPVETWRRWHITLTDWFRSYLFMPLTRSRYGKGAWHAYANLFLVYLLVGFWHGASWTFVVWGVLSGIIQIGYLATRRWHNPPGWSQLQQALPSFATLVQVGFTFHLLLWTAVFFRASSLIDAIYIFSHWWRDFTPTLVGLGKYELLIAAGATSLLLIVDLIHERQNIWLLLKRQPTWFRWSIYYLLVLSILFFGEFSYNEFAYFAF